jgi:hypothetical protein
MPASRLARAAYHEGAHAALAVIHHLPVRRVWIRDDGAGATEYSRQFVGTGEVEAWVTSTLCGIEAEVDVYGDAPKGGDLRVIEQMVRTLGITWTTGNLDRFWQRARTLVVQERRAITVLANVLCERRHMAANKIGAAVTAPRGLWVA